MGRRVAGAQALRLVASGGAKDGERIDQSGLCQILLLHLPKRQGGW